MQVIVNGEPQSCEKHVTLSNALEYWGYRLDLPMAIAVNHVVVHKTNFSQWVLHADDTIEILTPMQGG